MIKVSTTNHSFETDYLDENEKNIALAKITKLASLKKVKRSKSCKISLVDENKWNYHTSAKSTKLTFSNLLNHVIRIPLGVS
jgi:hypothetical protein